MKSAKKSAKNCIVHLYTGEGAGKTTSVLGVALRSIGHDQKVIILQFMTGRKDIGEFLIKDKLALYYEIHQFGREEWVNLEDPSEIDIILANKGIEFLREIISEKEKLPKLLILDEINLAAAIGLLKIDDVIEILASIPEQIHVYMTGRRAPKEFIDFADFVSEIKNLKSPKEMENVKGIEY